MALVVARVPVLLRTALAAGGGRGGSALPRRTLCRPAADFGGGAPLLLLPRWSRRSLAASSAPSSSSCSTSFSTRASSDRRPPPFYPLSALTAPRVHRCHPHRRRRRYLSTGAASSGGGSSSDIDSDPLYPPPTDASLHALGLPILVRAAHHASRGRVMCYDAYVHHHDHTRHPISGKGEGGGERRTGGERTEEETDTKKVEYAYGEVLALSSRVHRYLLTHRNSVPLDVYPSQTRPDPQSYDAPAPPRVAFLCHPGPSYVACQWAAWSSGCVAVPLCTVHRRAELRYVLEDCDPDFIVDGVTKTNRSGTAFAGEDGGGGDGDDDDGDGKGADGDGDGVDDPSGEGRELKAAAEEAGMADRLVSLGDVLAWSSRGTAEAAAADGPDGPLGAFLSKHDDDGEPPPLLPPNDTYELGSCGIVPSLRSPAMIVYTSGTTGKPKGVVSTHLNLYHQITDLVREWRWSADDSILHVLPLHHVHGIVNKLGCAAWAGASVEFMRFHPVKMWERLGVRRDPAIAAGERGAAVPEGRRSPTLLMAVPTVYAKMLEVLPTMPPGTLDDALGATLGTTVRLTVSGSAALPTSIFERWRRTTGHVMLERYGMTEFGMALSNPLVPPGHRRPGYVGLPLPSVQVKIVDEDTGDVVPNAEGGDGSSSSSSGVIDRSGELCVRGPTVFQEYWNKPHATAEAFDADGYFRTGDVAEYDPDADSYHILGRVSADIIKCGGHKLSSLQIERALLEHPRLEEAVVLGVPDDTYGERVGLICRLKADDGPADPSTDGGAGPGGEITLGELRDWCGERMAPYKVPTRLVVLRGDIPKNAMGKVSKKQLVHLFEEQ